MTRYTMHIGFDDTDSTRKGCTTYTATLAVDKLKKLGVKFIDYPNLIRLNPNAPWKTRGNGALCLRIRFETGNRQEIKEAVINIVEEQSDLAFDGTDPGIVFLERENIPREIRLFSRNTVTSIVNLKDALRLLAKFKAEAVGFKDGRGVIGALAAVGEPLYGDHTYEILAYRLPQNYGRKREANEDSIFKMDKETAPYTFNNVDTEKKRVIITPRGPDPILFGIRGETPEILRKAFTLVKPLEPIERWMIFRTNQGTDSHLKRVEKLSDARPYKPLIVRGTVSTSPKMIPGRHVIFQIKDDSAVADCAAYEPTGALRRIAIQLALGDQLEVYGGVRAPSAQRPLTINLEKIRVLKLATKTILSNPICPICGKRLKSLGRNQGFRCKKCRQKYRELGKVEVELERELKKGLYIAATRSQRHLTKPFRRYGLEKHNVSVSSPVGDWYFP